MMTTVLLVLTIVWVLALLLEVIPLFRLPLARRKRDLIVIIASLVTAAFLFSWLGHEQLHIFTGLLLLLSCVIASATFVFLKRIDYYVDDILREVFLIIVAATALVMTTAFWYWGIAQPTFSLLLLRCFVGGIPIMALLTLWIALKEDHTWWMLGVYIVLLVVKTLLFPLWGVWTIVLLLLYALMVGYILHWMAETTYAEKVLSWNISPSRVWIIVALSAGLLVLAF